MHCGARRWRRAAAAASRWLRLAAWVGACAAAGGPCLASEYDPPELAAEQERWLNDDELATRLAGFLWQAEPDPELRTWAARRQLHRPEVLRSQTVRLLGDERSREFVQAFLAHWLHLGGAASGVPASPRNAGKAAELDKARDFFARAIRENRRVVELIEADIPLLRRRVAAQLLSAVGRPDASANLARAVARSLIENARGAPLRETDDPAVDDILARSRVEGYGLGTLLHEVVQSELFQTR
jgi:hypothetical protein